jgi:hypothetical protein
MPTFDDPNWVFAGATTEGDALPAWPFNLWGFRPWQDEHCSVTLTEPYYREVRALGVYSILTESGKFTFAYGEFTNGVYGFHFPKA